MTAKYERKQEEAISALVTSATVAEAASKCGIAESTLYRWLKEPTFADLYDDARHAVREHAIASVQAIANEAVTALRGALVSPHDNVRVSAAKAILDFCVRSGDLQDAERQIAALEARIKAMKPSAVSRYA